MIQFLSLASGSSGNCYYLANEHTSILIDAGIGVRTIKKQLKEFGLSLESISAVLVTHDHIDHVKAVGHLGEKGKIPIYTTRQIHSGIEHNYCISKKLETSARYIEPEQPFAIGDFNITAFDVPHDSHGNVGYLIECEGKKLCLVTDAGHITEAISTHLCQADYLVLETNYDETMLQMGPYPAYLKERILSPTGHLSNREAAEFLMNNYTPKWKYIWLCHLSKDNNHPDLAYKTIEMYLNQIGVKIGEDIQIIPLRRTMPTGIFRLNEE